jgi:hypothetical protein
MILKLLSKLDTSLAVKTNWYPHLRLCLIYRYSFFRKIKKWKDISYGWYTYKNIKPTVIPWNGL